MTPTASTYRVASVDILRGLIMIIMALDHTRDFFHITAMTADPLDPATTTPALFFTRFITHYCAPGFVFLSGLSAWLSSRKKTKAEASVFLVKRGAWLVIVEVTLVTLGITFNPFYNFIVLQVIWAIGWSMIILGLLMRISYKVVLWVGILLVLG
ncbi:MAG TPA: heparan-alpha-glucosaminide N-acetyltransferase domain-containing protein, partial [Chitinophagaceae bacterium]|nr:heparan-alpha-glucosaminide N-acetyltransferase domain-containing protein [Chitinophagaceae bacterium]